MGTNYFPEREADAQAWLQNADALIAVNYATYGLEQSQAQHFTELVTAFVAARAKTLDGMSRSPGNIRLKDEAKAAAIEFARAIVGQIQKSPATTDAEREALRITIRKTPTQQKPPAFAPRASVLSVNGHTFTVAADDPAAETKRRKLPGTVGVWWYAYVGTEYPEDPGLWEFCGQSNRYSHEITLPPGLTPGTKVYFTAAWVDRKGQTGPVAVPAFGYVEYAGAANALKIKLAA